MTLPAERTQSVVDTRQFLEMLANAEEVTVPGLVQSVAMCLLKHFPRSVDLQKSASAVPEVWAIPSTHGPRKRCTASVRIVVVNGKRTDKR